jgi:integrase
VRRALKREGGRLVLGETKTSGSRRTLHLPAEVIEVLRRAKARQAAERLRAGAAWQESGLVVTTEVGTPYDPNNLAKRVSTLTKRAGLSHWAPHELRHSAASLLLAMGVPLKTVSETLGHSSITITADVYAHLLADQRKEAATAMGRALWGVK